MNLYKRLKRQNRIDVLSFEWTDERCPTCWKPVSTQMFGPVKEYLGGFIVLLPRIVG